MDNAISGGPSMTSAMLSADEEGIKEGNGISAFNIYWTVGYAWEVVHNGGLVEIIDFFLHLMVVYN